MAIAAFCWNGDRLSVWYLCHFHPIAAEQQYYFVQLLLVYELIFQFVPWRSVGSGFRAPLIE